MFYSLVIRRCSVVELPGKFCPVLFVIRVS